MSVNVINEYVNYSRKCINNYVKIIMDKYYDNESFNEFMETYIDIRYHNLYPKKNNKTATNIINYLTQTTVQLISDDNKSEKEKEDIQKMFYVFGYMLYFDNVIDCKSAKDIIKQINEFRINKLEIVEEDFEDKFFEILKNDLLKKKQYIENFNNRSFSAIYKKTNINNLYNVELEHNLKFSKIYSNYAIDKVFTSKEIDEQKLFILFPLVAAKALSDVINSDFKKRYLVDYNINLNKKEKKLKRLLELINDDIAKEKIIIKISFKNFIKEKDFYINQMRQGYNYAVIIDDSFNTNIENIELLKCFLYIIINQKNKYYEELSNLENLVVVR